MVTRDMNDVDLKDEVKVSRKDYVDNRGNIKFNKYEKRKRVMKDNLEASKLILASKERKAKEDQEQLYAGYDEVKKMKVEDNVPIEYKIKSVDMQIEALELRIKIIDNEERKNNGFLKESTRKRRDYYRTVLDDLFTEKSTYMKEAEKPKVKKPKVETIQPEGVKENATSNKGRTE